MAALPDAELTVILHRPRQKVPPFARYKGTSAWRKDRRRVRAYALFLAAKKSKAEQGAPQV